MIVRASRYFVSHITGTIGASITNLEPTLVFRAVVHPVVQRRSARGARAFQKIFEATPTPTERKQIAAITSCPRPSPDIS